MAVATSMAVMGGLGLAKGLYDTVSGSQREKARQAELDAYQRQELTNTYKDMKISTIGTDLMREEASRNMATSMNTIGNAGTRAIIGATPKLVAEQNNVGRAIQKDLDDQVIKRNYAIAGDDGRIRDMQEQRENADLAGLGNAIQVANQDANTGFNTALNGLAMIGSSIGNEENDSDPGEFDFSPDKSITPKIGWKPSSKYGTASSFQTKTPEIGLIPKSSSYNLYEYLNSLNRNPTYQV